MSSDLGRDIRDLEKLYARKLWADFRTLSQSPKKDDHKSKKPECRSMRPSFPKDPVILKILRSQ